MRIGKPNMVVKLELGKDITERLIKRLENNTRKMDRSVDYKSRIKPEKEIDARSGNTRPGG